ncbi:MAG: aldehyde dehydrogenase EutE [Bdellovibrionales bacterium RIFOXYD1_FULL_44_7]|nr:MAG: aldehyde dehydrogenase EutE [Bdellovibrionales bacterium RIFOXYD1_FULL_44_7]
MLSQEQINYLVDAVAARLAGKGVSSPIPRASTTASSVAFHTMDEAVEASKRAQPVWAALPLKTRQSIIEEMRCELRANVQELSRMAVEETGLGRCEDKINKNLLVIDKTPGPEYLESASYTGDDGLTLVEYAPYGIIGSITPTTNPSETIINNGISMLSAGNTVVFNPHPSALNVSIQTLKIMDQVIVKNGGPRGCLTMVQKPTIESAQALMTHPGIRLLVVTGGPAVVKAAMASGKKVIAAGPGNPPVVVDETADLDQAADGIIKGASLDNNIVCIAEKEIIAVNSIADQLIRKLQEHGAYFLNASQVKQLEKIIIDQESGGKYPNKNFVGKNASVILAAIGVQVPDNVRIAFCDVDENHPFVQVEMLLPVIPLVRTPNVTAAIETAKRVEHGNCHTAVMYSKNIDNLSNMAKAVNTSIFVKNGPSYCGLGFGGEGHTSFTIASPTGEGLTTCRTFSRIRRCVLKDHFRIV